MESYYLGLKKMKSEVSTKNQIGLLQFIFMIIYPVNIALHEMYKY